MRCVGSVTFLPKEFRGSQEETRAQLPPHHIRPLVDEHRQVAPALNPLTKEVAHYGLGSRADDVGLFQNFAARDRHYGQLRREALNVFRFALEETLRNQQREVDVLVAAGLEPVVQLALEQLPDSVAVGLDDHTAFDDLGGLRHVALKDDVLVPSRKILAPRSDWRFSHELGECSGYHF